MGGSGVSMSTTKPTTAFPPWATGSMSEHQAYKAWFFHVPEDIQGFLFLTMIAKHRNHWITGWLIWANPRVGHLHLKNTNSLLYRASSPESMDQCIVEERIRLTPNRSHSVDNIQRFLELLRLRQWTHNSGESNNIRWAPLSLHFIKQLIGLRKFRLPAIELNDCWVANDTWETTYEVTYQQGQRTTLCYYMLDHSRATEQLHVRWFQQEF